MAKIQNDLNGWLIIDKPYDMGSTNVVSRLKWLLKPKKIGHAGTLDPLATGVLPIALGKATKTIPFVMDGKKTYRFIVKWGSQTSTDDAEGEITNRSDNRPTVAQIKAILPNFIGDIMQTPPAYSALKIDGVRAYELARKGNIPEMKPRPVHIDDLRIVPMDLSCCQTGDMYFQDDMLQQETMFEVDCGKGTYVRSLGREMGQMLGCFGHITMLRRIKCGPFSESDTILLANLEKNDYNTNALSIIPVDTALSDISVLAVNEVQMKRLMNGQTISCKEFDVELLKEFTPDTVIGLQFENHIMALAKIERGGIKPFRIL